ncbi:MAG TPA: hypothetical protein PKK10_09650 [Woeseiaceae bacterium]|nr:hypothetical protein [Woeseiaceae bacterium]
MKKLHMAITVAILGMAVNIAVAQEDEPPTRFTYATYFNCNAAMQDAVDDMVADDVAVMDKLVDQGTILGWGWLAHHTGGQWRRVRYSQAGSIEDLLDAQDAIGEALDAAAGNKAAAAKATKAFNEACPSHDDYIWSGEIGSQGSKRGAASFSVYYVCDVGREDRADEIVKEHFAPIFDKLVKDGSLTTWGWSSHIVGGKYRKLQTMTAASQKSLIKARSAAIAALYGDDGDNAMGQEFAEICGPHVDYMWDIVHEKTM